MSQKCCGCLEIKHIFEFSKSQRKKKSQRRCKICIQTANKPMNKLEMLLSDIYKNNQIIKEQTECLLQYKANKNNIRKIPDCYKIILVDGYIRISISNLNMWPKSLNKLIFNLYNKKTMKFYEKSHGHSLRFTDNRVIKTMEDCQRSTCLFGDAISSSIYDEYRVKFSWYGMYFFMGYITSSIKEFAETNGWSALGYENSVGIKVDTRKTMFMLHIDGNETELEYESDYDRYIDCDNDIFEMVFNFSTKTLTIYHNNKKAIVLSIGEQKSIQVGFTTGGWGMETITILDYSCLKTI